MPEAAVVSSALPIRIIDGITDFIEANVDLPAHKVVKYRRCFVQPKDCPLLNVFLVSKQMVPRGTETLNASQFIAVTWFEKGVADVLKLQKSPRLATSLIHHISLIEQGLMDLWVSGWRVEGAYEVQPVSLDWQPPVDVASGLVEGYSVAVQVFTVQSRNDLT